MPEGWVATESRSTGMPYYVNTKTGASQYDFPTDTARAWDAYGACHLYGSNGAIPDEAKKTRRLSI